MSAMGATFMRFLSAYFWTVPRAWHGCRLFCADIRNQAAILYRFL